MPPHFLLKKYNRCILKRVQFLLNPRIVGHSLNFYRQMALNYAVIHGGV
jgi:hypothetical protein